MSYENNIEVYKASRPYDEKKRRRNIGMASWGGALLGSSPWWGSTGTEAAALVNDVRRSKGKVPRLSPSRVGLATGIGAAGLGVGLGAAGISSEVRHMKRDRKLYDKVGRDVQRKTWLYRALNDKKK